MSANKSPAKIPPRPTKETIYVDVEDEITAIIDKVENATQKIVALVLPKRATALQSIVNMRLLKRNAEKAAKNVVLITNEEILLPLAGAVGLHVAKNLQSKPEVPAAPSGVAKEPAKKLDLPEEEPVDPDEHNAKLDYHRSIGELAAAHAGDDAPIDLEDADGGKHPAKKDKPKKDKRLRVPNFDRFRALIGLGGLGILLLIVFLFMAIWVWPKATVTIHTESLPVEANLSLNTSDSAKTLDEAKHIIPAFLKTSDQTATQQFQATGQQNNGTKAIGSVTMTAQKCSGNPFVPPSDVPSGTGLSANGSTYITQGNTSFHGTGTSGGCYTYAADSSTAIAAQSGGAKFNTSSSNFSVAGRPDVSATGSASGGTDNITTIVSQADLDSAKSKVTSQSSDTFTKAFEDQLAKAGLYVLSSTLKLSDPNVTSSPAVGQPASNVTATIKITYSVLAVQKSDLTKALTDELNKQVNAAKQKLSDTDVLKGATVSVQNQSSPTAVTLSVSKSTTAVPLIDVPAVQKQVAGQKSGDIRSALGGIPGVKSVDVKMSPFWVSKAPKKASHVHVVLVQVKGQGNAAP